VAPCAFVAVRDITRRLLLVRRCDTGDWELPGGRVDPGESASDTAVRETAEESGITVEITGLVGIYTDPGHVITEPHTGLVRQPFAVCFHARPLSGSPGGDQTETSDALWFTIGDIPALPGPSGVQPAHRCPASGPGRPAAACPPGGSHLARQRVPQPRACPAVRPISYPVPSRPGADGASGLTAITVIDQHSRYLHSHACPCRSPAWRWRTGLARSRRIAEV
jgi:8-oxo-dGTP diphosphatase